MYTYRALWASALALCLSWSTAHSWEKLDSEDGITSYRKAVKGSKVVAFKGEAEIKASISRILWVLTDNEHRTKWVHRLKSSTVLEKKSQYESIIYQKFGLPFPISNRDYVYHAKVERVGPSVVVNLKSVFHPKAPKPDGVRAQLTRCQYILSPLGPDKTYVTVEVHTDPRGWLPTWLVNLIQKKWPIQTLSGIKRMVKKSFAKDVAIPPAG